MKKNRCLSWLIIAMFMFCSVFTFAPQGALAAQFTDVDNHWAASQIKSMVDQGVATGYPDNTFKPDAQVTRAEFATLVNKAFQFTATADINYPDVKASDWFAPEIGKAKAAGYLGGYSDGTIKPNNKLSRQEAAVIIAKALKLDASGTEAVSKFQDLSSIPDWSKGSIAALVSKAYMGGYPDGTFQPAKTITRAEAVVILANATGVVVTPTEPSKPAPTVEITKLDKAGTYGPATGNEAVKGDVTISAAGVNLQNQTISGDLLIAEGVGNGDVSLKNITVKGTTTIKGGGPNTVKVDGCVLGKVVINKSDGNIRVLLSGSTTISDLVVDSAAKVAGQATITRATVNKANVVIEAKPGSFTVSSGITATINGKSETGTASTSTSGGSGGGNSSGTNNVVAAVTASPASGTAVTVGSSVYLYTATAGATIYYTTDGITTPTTSSYCYSNSGIQITKATTIKAIAVKSGLTTSAISTFVYSIGQVPGGLPAEVQGFTANVLAGQTYVTVSLKAASAATVDKVFVNGLEAVAQSDGVTYKKTLSGTVASSAVTITVQLKGAPELDKPLPAEVDSFTANVLAGQTYVTVSLKAASAATVDKVFVNGLEAVAQSDGLTFKKTLSGTVAHTAITVTVQKKIAEQDKPLPAEVDSFTANVLAGQTYVTVSLKAASAATIDKVFVNGLEAVAQSDGVTFKKTLDGTVAHSAITITVQKKAPVEPTALIVKTGCTLSYVEMFGQTRARVQTTAAVTGVTANGTPMLMVDGKWQLDLDGNIASVTIVATDGTHPETYILTK